MIRIVSYNVHACIGSDGRFEPARIADVLHALRPDFVALQEIEDRAYRGDTVSEFLATSLGMAAHHGSTLRRGDSPYGNLLLARQPADDVHTHDLSVPGGEPRGAIEARFELAELRLRLLADRSLLNRASFRKRSEFNFQKTHLLLIRSRGREERQVPERSGDDDARNAPPQDQVVALVKPLLRHPLGSRHDRAGGG